MIVSLLDQGKQNRRRCCRIRVLEQKVGTHIQDEGKP